VQWRLIALLLMLMPLTPLLLLWLLRLMMTMAMMLKCDERNTGSAARPPYLTIIYSKIHSTFV
jgi:hypothetical protein